MRTLSAIFVVTANAWMNAPAGFRMVDGEATEIDPIAAMLNPASLHEVLHMTLAAFVATGFAVAAVHAFFLLRKPRSEFHRGALGIALLVGCVSSPLQILSGLPNDDSRTTSYALHIPRGLSLLTAHDPQARIAGLEEFPRANWPNVRLVHWSFDLMVGSGFALLGDWWAPYLLGATILTASGVLLAL